ncbi:MAG: hypothetical protein AAFW66_13985, partial [Pseudomonadota bacterium]
DFEKPDLMSVKVEDKSIEIAGDCRVNLNMEDQHIQAVYAESPYTESDLFVLTKKDLDWRSKNYLKSYQERGRAPKTPVDSRHQFHVAHAYVTKTDKPLTLVLISNENTIWDVQAKPAAQISNIVIVTSGTAAIANAPSGARTVAISKQNSPHCFVDPARPPQKYWRAVENAKKNPHGLQAEKIKERRDQFYKFDHWFQANFGQSSEKQMIGSAAGSHFLVGPQPTSAERIRYRPISKAGIKMSRLDLDIIRGESAYEKTLLTEVRARAESLIGGPLSMLNKRAQ